MQEKFPGASFTVRSQTEFSPHWNRERNSFDKARAGILGVVGRIWMFAGETREPSLGYGPTAATGQGTADQRPCGFGHRRIKRARPCDYAEVEIS